MLKALENKDLEKSTMPLFSIVMPSYNRKDRLARSLEHLAKQTYPAHLLEMVVVLDGCTDGSEEMMERLRSSFPFELKVISQPQSGPAAARNAGVRAAKGEYVLFVDDDVMVTPQLIVEHWESHSHNPKLVVVGTMSKPSDYKGSVWTDWEQYILEEQYKEILGGKYNMTARQFYTGNCSLKRQWLLDAGLFDEEFKRYEDVELACRMQYLLGVQFEFKPTAIGYHYVDRSWQSWTKAHYLYGRYAVKIDREKNLSGWIQMSKEEFETRHWVTKVLSKALLDRPRAQSLATKSLLQVALLSTRLKQVKISNKIMSSIANILYWQGFNEELRLGGDTQTDVV